jgi:beta propeller repeat protein
VRKLSLKAFVALSIIVVGILCGFRVAPAKAQLTIVETQITTDPDNQWMPAIYGDRIVWMDERNDNTDIYMYDLSTETETQITTDPDFQYGPAIYGDRIVWEDRRNPPGYSDIYMYDLATSTETPITIRRSEQQSTAIYGDRIVWEDNRDSPPGESISDIYMYDLATSTETQITTDPAHQRSPAIYGDRIVWYDDRNGNWDIYMAELSVGPTPSDAIEKTEDIKTIAADPSQIPVSDFDGATDRVKDNRRNALLNRLDAVIIDIETAMASTNHTTQRTAYQSAIYQLNSLFEKTDGCSERGTPDTRGSGYTPDWIITCDSQALIDPLIRDLIATLETLLAQIP